MGCGNIQKKLDAYFYGQLPDKEKAAIGKHLQACRSCKKEHEQIEKISALIGELPAGFAGPDIAPAVMERIAVHECRSCAASIRLWLAGLRTGFAAATALVMILGFVSGFGIVRQLSQSVSINDFDDDTVYFELFTDAPPSSIADGYLDSINSNGDNAL